MPARHLPEAKARAFCPGEPNREVWLRGAAGQPPGGRWAEGSSLRFRGARLWLNQSPRCLHVPPFPPSVQRIDTLWPYCRSTGGAWGFLSRTENKGILLLTYFSSLR